MIWCECPHCESRLTYYGGLWFCQWCVESWPTADLPNLDYDIPKIIDVMMEICARLDCLEKSRDA
jgi:hypothetical protein